MNKFVQGALSIAVGLGAFYGVKSLKQQAFNSEPTAAELVSHMDDLRARAVREHPGMSQTDALKEVATEDSAKTLAAKNDDQKADSAANMFWGFYWMNTRARFDYCTQRGVDLTPFKVAFDRQHAGELARAKAVYAADGINPLDDLPKFMPMFAKLVEQDMKDVTTGAGVPLDQACELFNANAEEIADLLQMPPHVRAALMSG